MYKKLCILLVFRKLKVTKLLIDKYYTQYSQVAGNLVTELGNVPRRGVVPRFSDLKWWH